MPAQRSAVAPMTVLGMPVEGLAVCPLAVNALSHFGVVEPFGKPVGSMTQTLIAGIEIAAHDILHGFVKHDASAHDDLL